MSELSDLVVLVTGSSTGIGRALGLEFARRGHHTYATARRLQALDGLEAERLVKLELDVTAASSIESAVKRVIEQSGRIDMLVNNAGINAFGPLAELPLDQVRRLYETNLFAPLALVQAVFPHMVRRRTGRIVNIGSVAGILPTPFAGSYCASKAGLHMLSEVLRMEVAPFGIDVIVVQPGAVRSNIAASGSVDIERYSREASHYRRVYEAIQARANASQVAPMETHDFARQTVDAVTRRHPARVVRLGKGAGAFSALGRLPGPLLDRLMARRFGLGRLKTTDHD
jgi:NAD(P)-dependent dehydrogenase (short-subunit alcohol dehydrogenase family)